MAVKAAGAVIIILYFFPKPWLLSSLVFIWAHAGLAALIIRPNPNRHLKKCG